MSNLSVADVDRARRDPVVFADLLLHQPLWGHQVDVVRSPARYRVLCAGRRAGKTRVFGTLALHRMFSRPGSKVMIVSAGDISVKRTHAEIASMVNSAIGTASSVVDDNVHTLTLSNGSTLESVPSSVRAVRSADVDLLIIDEAGFVDQAVWESAEPVIGARPGARVLIASTPWMGPGHFFHDLWRQGMDRPDSEITSWHWPTSISPLVDPVWLEGVKGRSSWDYFAREYEAQWTGASGAYFDEGELMRCVADYPLLDADEARRRSPFVTGEGTLRALAAVAGVDWGMRRDSNAVALISPLEDFGLNDALLGEAQRAMYVPYLAARPNWEWHDFADHVADLADAFDMKVIASEVNGVGDAATSMLYRATQKLAGARRTHVSSVWTDMRRKQAGFGKMKMLFQRGLLVLPRHPELLKQLRGLEFEQTQAGGVRIAVPENRGHDDLAMALMQAVSCLTDPELWRWSADLTVFDREDLVDRVWRQYREERDRAAGRVHDEPSRTAAGLIVPADPLPMQSASWTWFSGPQGAERGEAW